MAHNISWSSILEALLHQSGQHGEEEVDLWEDGIHHQESHQSGETTMRRSLSEDCQLNHDEEVDMLVDRGLFGFCPKWSDRWCHVPTVPRANVHGSSDRARLTSAVVDLIALSGFTLSLTFRTNQRSRSASPTTQRYWTTGKLSAINVLRQNLLILVELQLKG